MPTRRLLRRFLGLSVALHGIALYFAYLLPPMRFRPVEVMEVDLTDIPRTTDFLPAEPGILEGRTPLPVPPPPVRPETRQAPPPEALAGRVPDLPVKPELPPEKSFPQTSPKPVPAPETKPSPGPEASGSARTSEAGRTGPSKSLRELTPSLGKMVMAREEPAGGRGRGDTSGSTVGTGGEATGKEGITEETGGGFHMTSLNAPEIQYISYFASIKRKIELVWQYPYEAAVAGIQGELEIDFTIGRSGKLDAVALVRGSGHRILDEEALRSIRKAAPFDPIPAQYKIPGLRIRGRFVYIHGGTLRLR